VPTFRFSVGAAEPVTTTSDRFIALAVSAMSPVLTTSVVTATARDAGA